jgi:hypothetical protein
VYSESEDNDDVSGVEVDENKELNDTSDTIDIDPSFYFFFLSYTYLTSPEFEFQHIQTLSLLNHFFVPQSRKKLTKKLFPHLPTSHHPPLVLCLQSSKDEDTSDS